MLTIDTLVIDAIVDVLLTHESDLSDGYGYYIPAWDEDDDSELYTKFNGNKVLWYLTKLAKEINGAINANN